MWIRTKVSTVRERVPIIRTCGITFIELHINLVNHHLRLCLGGPGLKTATEDEEAADVDEKMALGRFAGLKGDLWRERYFYYVYAIH